MSDIQPNGHFPKADWSDEDYNIFATWIRSVLHTNNVEVVFTKKDGEERVMNCTLNPDKIPPVVVVEGAVKKERTPDKDPMNIRVYDLDKGAWRAFNARNVKTVRFNFV